MRNLYAALFVSLLLFLVFAGIQGLTAPQPSPPPKPRLKWYKGNTHTHTLNSDGDSTPDEVVRWYRKHGYHFHVLTDHNFLTNVDGLNALHGADEKFLVIRGEEVSDQFGGKPLHINGFHLKRLVKPQGGSSVVETLQRNVDAIRKESGVPHINHPNFGWAITANELRQVRNNKLFEIYNGHPHVNNQGGGGVPGLEAVWEWEGRSLAVRYRVRDRGYAPSRVTLNGHDLPLDRRNANPYREGGVRVHAELMRSLLGEGARAVNEMEIVL